MTDTVLGVEVTTAKQQAKPVVLFCGALIMVTEAENKQIKQNKTERQGRRSGEELEMSTDKWFGKSSIK